MVKLNKKKFFSDNLKASRIKAGLSQRELSKMSGVSQSVISNIECGVSSTPRTSSLNRIESVLEVVDSELCTADLVSKEQFLQEKEMRLTFQEKLLKYRSIFDLESLSESEIDYIRCLVQEQLEKRESCTCN